MPPKSISFASLGTKRGIWQEPRYSPLPASNSSTSQEDTVMTVKETQETTRHNSPESNTNDSSMEIIDSTTIYHVYKKRWIGVVIIMLLNIVSSWRYFTAFRMY
jgi:hypothetical protein